MARCDVKIMNKFSGDFTKSGLLPTELLDHLTNSGIKPYVNEYGSSIDIDRSNINNYTKRNTRMFDRNSSAIIMVFV